jgi:hypothetical protein
MLGFQSRRDRVDDSLSVVDGWRASSSGTSASPESA